MHELVKLIILGAIQGVTEFLPISSSGHLVLTKSFLGFPSEGAFLEVALHAGTLVPILIFYRKRIWGLASGLLARDAECWRTAGMLIAATIPTGIAFLTVKDILDRAYQSPLAAALALCVTGIIMMIPVRRQRERSKPMTLTNAMLIGIAQAFALTPGISRSGSTIIMARQQGVSAEKAAEFSFLMAIPVLLAAVLLELPHLGEATTEALSLGGVVLGMLTAATVGYVSLVLLIKMLAKGKFWVFGLYCLISGGTAVGLITF
jgi:undecaprenyl-diphosphatase